MAASPPVSSSVAPSSHEWERNSTSAIGSSNPFVSQLVTAGVQRGYVSKQLSHTDVGVTARYYARWCGDDAYREPMQPGAGEVPADYLARLVESPESPPTSLPSGAAPGYAESRKIASNRVVSGGVCWWAALWIRCSSGDMIGLCGFGRGSRGCTHLHLENPTARDGRSGSASPDNIRFYNWMHRLGIGISSCVLGKVR
jgi:hypothetical protein